MAFLLKSDFEHLIPLDEIDEITGSDDALINDALAAAEEEVKSYLRQRYNVVNEFAKTGTDRNDLLMRLVADVTLYELHSRINPRNIPAFRIEKRDDAIKYLGKVANPRHGLDMELELVDHGENKGLDITFGNSANTSKHNY